MINLALRSEFSFKKVFAPMKRLVAHGSPSVIGIADHNNTFAHVLLEKECKEKDIKPIFGVRLEVIEDRHLKSRGVFGPIYTFIAKDEYGLHEINNLTKIAWDNFYYKPMVTLSDVFNLSQSVFVIAETFETPERLDYIAITQTTPLMIVNGDFDMPVVYMGINTFIIPEDEDVYQLMMGTEKRGEGYNHKFESQTYPQHIMSEQEANHYLLTRKIDCEMIACAISETEVIANQCNVKLPKATMVKYKSEVKTTIDDFCIAGAKRLKIDIESGEYADRLKLELDLIKEKDFVDYFLIVGDLVSYAKKTMFVGPSRGSSAGSLVCYLMGITEVDPILHGLLFERFIDANRNDWPDIDIDFPDDAREGVIKYLFDKYGSANVCHISNINRMKAKSAIDEFGKSLCIPKYEVDVLKDSIVDRSGGDARAAMAIADTIDTTDAGKKFIEKYPNMMLVKHVEGHAAHAGKHAAGIIVCNEPLSTFGAINSREGSIQMDKKGAEYLSLLKIDALGLRTLSVLSDAATQVGFDYREFYRMPLDNQAAFDLLDNMRLYGIFQFEGHAMRMLCAQMGIKNFTDIVAITALARPGPLHSGGADEYVRRRTGKEPTVYISQHPSYIEQTKDTYGVIIYQEQLMTICRECGSMSWNDVQAIRRAASKTLGKEFFDKYRKKFVDGAVENGIEENDAIKIWENMVTFGSWGMNKSHTVSYGLISYWCAYMKANHPLEFACANLRHSKNKDSALRILRDAVENDGIEYIPFDADDSEIQWSVKNGKLLGGLVNIHGIGEKKAADVLKMRQGKKKFTPGIVDTLLNPTTDFDTLYPCKDMWSHVYDNPSQYAGCKKIHNILDMQESGSYTFIGQLRAKDLRDLNEYNELVKRGGKRYEENNFVFKIVVEDDTDQIHCRINRFNFDKLEGKTLAETGVEDKTYYIIRGKLKDGWRIIDIDAIYDLTIDAEDIFSPF